MNDTRSISDSTETVEFYAPATFQFSTNPGRIERFLASVFRQRGGWGSPRTDEADYGLETRQTTPGAVRVHGRRPNVR